MLVLEELTVVLTHIFVHVLAAGVRQILPIQQPAFVPCKLDQTEADFGVADIQENYVFHLF